MAIRYDIHFQGVPESRASGTKCFEFGFQAPLKIAGFQALINRWVKTLMTPRGTDLLDKNYGTDFSSLIGANMTGDPALITDVVEMAIADTVDQVKKQDAVGLFDASEQLMSAEVLGYEQTDDGYAVWVRIRNVAGDSAEFAVATIGVSRY
jgi:hypothetical protein